MRSNVFLVIACYLSAQGLVRCVLIGDTTHAFVFGILWMIAAGVYWESLKRKAASPRYSQAHEITGN